MQPRDESRFHLRHNGRLIEVEIESKFMKPVARLLIDGELLDEQSTWPKTTRLKGSDLNVHVEWTLLSSPQRAWATFHHEKAIEKDEDGESETRQPEYDLIPPQGSWAERVFKVSNDHPNVWASRHVIKATLQAVLGIIGIGAILWGLLPRFDIDIPFPDINPGDWIRSVVPNWFVEILQLPQHAFTWLFGWVPEITFINRFIDWIRNIGFPPDWLKSVVSSARYWIPVLIAVGVALNEIERRNKKVENVPEDDANTDDQSDAAEPVENLDSRLGTDERDSDPKQH